MPSIKTNPDTLLDFLLQKDAQRAKSQRRAKKGKPVGTLWNPYRDGVTFSLLSSFTSCRERTRLKYVEGYTPVTEDYSLEFGNLFHLMKQVAYTEGNGNRSPGFRKGLKVAKERANQYIKQKVERYGYTGTELKKMNQLYQTGIATFHEYWNCWRENPTLIDDNNNEYFDGDFKRIDQEREFRVPYTLNRPGSKQVILQIRGKIDGEIGHPVTGRVLIEENKTKARIDDLEIVNYLHKDLQTGIYIIANMDRTGELPEGVLYDVIRRSGKNPRKEENLSDFIDRLRADMRANLDYYFMRFVIEDLKQEDVDRFKRIHLDPLLWQLVDWWESIKDNPLDPWITKKKFDLEAMGVFGKEAAKKAKRKGRKPKEVEEIVPNHLHWERPFGLYQGGNDTAYDMAPIILENDTSAFYKRTIPFPELDAELENQDEE